MTPDLVQWEAVNAYFKAHRGRGFTYRTLQAWQTMEGFPCVQEGRGR